MKLAATALLLSLAACSHHATDHVVSKDEASKLLIDRNWIDRMPQTERDKLFVYRFVPSMGGGVFQDRTIFKGTFELFKFAIDGDQIEFDLLETHDKVRSQFHIEKVDGPAPFDLKLDDPERPARPAESTTASAPSTTPTVTCSSSGSPRCARRRRRRTRNASCAAAVVPLGARTPPRRAGSRWRARIRRAN